MRAVEARHVLTEAREQRARLEVVLGRDPGGVRAAADEAVLFTLVEQPASHAGQQPRVPPRRQRREPDPGLVARPQRARRIPAREVVGGVERPVGALQLLQAVKDRGRAVDVTENRQRGGRDGGVVGPGAAADRISNGIAGRGRIGRYECHDRSRDLERGFEDVTDPPAEPSSSSRTMTSSPPGDGAARHRRRGALGESAEQALELLPERRLGSDRHRHRAARA